MVGLFQVMTAVAAKVNNASMIKVPHMLHQQLLWQERDGIHQECNQASQRVLVAIRKFPVPKNISAVHSFYGMIHQINYAFTMKELMETFCHLLKSDTPFCWSPIFKRSWRSPRR